MEGLSIVVMGGPLPSRSFLRATVYDMSEGKNREFGWWTRPLRWWKLHWLQVLGCLLTTASIVVMVALAWLGAVGQPSRAEVALIALVGASFQLVAALGL